MKLTDIIKYSSKPKIYEKGSAVMWTDEHISKQLLEVHLNEHVDLASRKKTSINNTVEWILDKAPKEKLNILDLGCGPGLYTSLFAKKDHWVTGVDFSQNSINYAREQAQKNNVDIKYIQADYLELELPENSFDLVILIFTDIGVLLPNDRIKMIQFVKKILKPGGTFIFDVLNDKDLDQKTTPKNWEAVENGFWKPEPYLALSESFLYEKEKVILYQHIVNDEKESVKSYRFWTHFFSDSDLEELLMENGFSDFTFYKNILPEEDKFSGENVTFVVAKE